MTRTIMTQKTTRPPHTTHTTQHSTVQNNRAQVVFALGVAAAVAAAGGGPTLAAALLELLRLPEGLRVCCVLASSVGKSRAVIGMCDANSRDCCDGCWCCGWCSDEMAGEEMDDVMGRAVMVVVVAEAAAGGVVATAAALCAQGASLVPDADRMGDGRAAWRCAN